MRNLKLTLDPQPNRSASYTYNFIYGVPAEVYSFSHSIRISSFHTYTYRQKILVKFYKSASNKSFWKMFGKNFFTNKLKSSTLMSLSGKLANFTLATLISLHYNIYEDRVKLATFKIGYLN